MFDIVITVVDLSQQITVWFVKDLIVSTNRPVSGTPFHLRACVRCPAAILILWHLFNLFLH